MRNCRIGLVVGILMVVAFCVGAADEKNKTAKKTPAIVPAVAAPASPAEKSNAGDQDESQGNTAEVGSEPASKYPAEESAILKTAEEFVKAYANHDAQALAGLFADEAEYVDVDGQVFAGREAIEKTLAECFKKNPECALLLDVALIRFLGPNLAIEDGTTVCTLRQDGPAEESRYTAIHTKTDGKWQMASVRERGSSNPRQHAQRLKQLDWLIGNWIDEDHDSVVHFNCRLSDDKNFLIRDFAVTVGGEKELEGTQRIGWDPVSGKFRTWTFDSQGGYFDGYFIRDGQRWIHSSSGVTADGHAASGKMIFTPVNDQTITWQSIDREVNGVPLDDSEEYTLVKKGPQPEEHARAEKQSKAD